MFSHTHTHTHTNNYKTHTLCTHTMFTTHSQHTHTLCWLVFEWSSRGWFCVNIGFPFLSVAQWVWHLLPVIMDLQLLNTPVDGSQQVLQILGISLQWHTASSNPTQTKSRSATFGTCWLTNDATNLCDKVLFHRIFTSPATAPDLNNIVISSQGDGETWKTEECPW